MIQINKNKLPEMTVHGSVRVKKKYTLAESIRNNFRLVELAEIIAKDVEIPFILYDCNDTVYTDNEDVLQILKKYFTDTYGTVLASMQLVKLNTLNIKISFDRILNNTDERYSFQNYSFRWKWYVLYKELSTLLYMHNNNTNIKNTVGQRLYNTLIQDSEFVNENQWIKNFETAKSLDPIHIFASINSNKLGHEKRVLRIKILFKLLAPIFSDKYKLSFHISNMRDEIDFNGCPAPMITKIIGARKKNIQTEVWNIFNVIMQSSQSASIDFKLLNDWYGIDIGSFTIFLFWIDAKNFLPLDKNTEALLKKYHKLIDFPQVYDEYKKLLVKKNVKLYINLALIAYDGSELEKLNRYENKELESYLGINDNNTDETISSSNDFKIIALRPLSGCNDKYLKTLKENEYYIFDKAYNIDENKLTIDEIKNISLFNLTNVNLNINAIVGKNGTGKSTLVELMFALIYNISCLKELNKNVKIDGLKVELIYKTQYIYKVKLDEENLQVFKYNEKDSTFVDCIDSFDIQELFYTIAVNYSQHSFNRLTLGDWIHSLFHKNDSYKTPIVIEPYRKDGNIDVNRQEELIKRRLLSNLLLPEDLDDIKNSPRQLTEFYRAEALRLTFNINKIFYRTDKLKQISMKHIYKDEENKINLPFGTFEHNYIDILQVLYAKFEINNLPTKHFRNNNFSSYTFEDKVHLYILKKLVSIVIRYEKYQNYFNLPAPTTPATFQNLKECVDEIYKDKSHICYKLKQALYFLRFETLIKKVETEQHFSIKELSKRIDDTQNDNVSEKLTTNELIPPAFFDVEIILENDINFNTLSSGEKQKIYSVNSILYHLNNIDSVDEKLTKYSYVNIILDEIELYFHPELQRQYLTHLRHAISKANTNKISAINILFVTHSPFILSDIPDSKILFLDKENKIDAKSLPVEGVKTFGANIHELLINGFFMQNSIGAFALETIKEIVNFYTEIIRADQTKTSNLKEKYQEKKQRFYFIQQSIGEKYISDIIQNHIEEIEKKLDATNFRIQRIRDLRDELAKLESVNNDTN